MKIKELFEGVASGFLKGLGMTQAGQDWEQAAIQQRVDPNVMAYQKRYADVTGRRTQRTNQRQQQQQAAAAAAAAQAQQAAKNQPKPATGLSIWILEPPNGQKYWLGPDDNWYHYVGNNWPADYKTASQRVTNPNDVTALSDMGQKGMAKQVKVGFVPKAGRGKGQGRTR